MSAVATMPTTTPTVATDVEERRFAGADWQERMLFASVEQDPEVLDQMALDPHSAVVEAVATNPHTDAKTLSGLARHPNWLVRYLVALHERTPCAIRILLQDDPFGWVRFAARRACEAYEAELPPVLALGSASLRSPSPVAPVAAVGDAL